MDSSSDLDLLVIGKPGSGKSATGNSILLNPDEFKINYNTTSDEKFPQYRVTRFNDCHIQVVECPGVIDMNFDSTVGIKGVVCAVLNSVLVNKRGFHVLLIVIKFAETFLNEDLRCLQILKIIFGENVLKSRAIIVMSHGDKFFEQYPTTGDVTLEYFCQETTGPFKELLEECSNRIVLLDNKTENKDIKNKQLEHLMKTIDKLETKGKRCTTESFKSAVNWTQSMHEYKSILLEQDFILQNTSHIKIEYSMEELMKTLQKLKKSSKNLRSKTTKNKELEQNLVNTLKCIEEMLSFLKKDNKEKIKEIYTETLPGLKEQFRQIKQDADDGYFYICYYLVKQQDHNYIGTIVDKVKHQLKTGNNQMSLPEITPPKASNVSKARSSFDIERSRKSGPLEASVKTRGKVPVRQQTFVRFGLDRSHVRSTSSQGMSLNGNSPYPKK